MSALIKGERVPVRRRAASLLRHLLKGEENDSVTLLEGTEDDFHAAFSDARSAGKKFCLRHFIIAPGKPITRADAMMIFGLLKSEFAFEQKSALSVEHEKPRAVAAFDRHWHFLVPEIDPTTGRVMSSRFNYLRHAKVAAIASHRLGFDFVRFAKERALLAALESDGHLDVAAAYRKFIENDPDQPHREAFSRNVHQMGKRLGVDIPKVRAVVRAAWETTTTWPAFVDALDAHRLRIATGKRPGTLIIESHGGVFAGAAHRLARVSKVDLYRRKEHSHERAAEAESRLGPEEQSIAAAGPCIGVPVADARSDPPDSGEPGGFAPADRRDCPAYPSGFAERLRIALGRDPSVARRLLDQARYHSRSPLERVRALLGARIQRLEQELKSLLYPALPSTQLDDARRAVSTTRDKCAKAKEWLDARARRRASYLQTMPAGLLAGLQGQKKQWRERLARFDRKVEEVREQEQRLWKRHREQAAIVADLERELRNQRHKLVSSAPHQKKLTRCKRNIQGGSVANMLLAKDPLLAFGGLAMVVAAAMVAMMTDGALGAAAAAAPVAKPSGTP